MNILKSWTARLPQMCRDAPYLLFAWPLSLFAFCLVIPLLATGVSTVIIWVGLFVLVAALVVAGGFA
ncbi:MAG: hypothetical protein Q4C85_00210 [Actinomyces sp.]|uniref:hypothetical protein n=1 Tax=Actinomyces sp. TaxID=29317 RepID=UPI0026DC91ED|nr:hypothetical protein [Actinomyces sp.]MDO4242189.1 hypothetical protein [Actinomyces sp.]